MKILTVDDSALIRKLVSNAIECAGFEAVHASNGREALNALDSNQDISLVILDWNMPVMDGFTCLQHIRANANTLETPVMMLTTETERERMISAIRAGANSYLTKPFRPEDLVVKMMECLSEQGY